MVQHEISQEDIEALDNLQAKHNNARGINCVRHIVFYLKRGEYQNAAAVRQTDGDKTLSYPDVERQLLKMFGCRTHLVKDCKNWLCVKINQRI